MNNPFTLFLKLSIIPVSILLIILFYPPFTKVNTQEQISQNNTTTKVDIGQPFLYGFGENPDWELNLVRRDSFAEVVFGDKRDSIVYNGYVNYDSLSENNFVYQGAVKNNKSTTTDIFTVELIPTKCKTQSGVEGEFAIKIFAGDKRFGGCANGKKI